MTRTRIKICGITRRDDAGAAVSAGADAVGVIFAVSPRQLSIAAAAEVLADVPPPVARIGVFVDAPVDEIAAAVQACGLTAVQLSGSEPPQALDALPVPAIKVLHVGAGVTIGEAAEPYRGRAAALLLDTLVPGMAGGTSRSFDWHAAGALPAWAPVFVAGGLHPGNVAECIRALHPFAVDVSSGVEASPGIKDHDMMDALCAAARDADLEA